MKRKSNRFFCGGTASCSLFLRGVTFFGENKTSSRITPPPSAARVFPGFPPTKTGGGWVVAGGVLRFFFVVALGAKKNEKRNAKTGGEKREKGEAETREEEEKHSNI